jgi:DNA repair exonuclease SbcCD nuclease subunit
VKFIHTSDWQIGMPFGQFPDKAQILRKARVDVVKQVLALAESEQVDFVVAAGDLFDDNRISPGDIEELAAIVSRCAVPVFLLPGNHDPFTQDSPYVRYAELFKESAVVMRAPEPIRLRNVSLYPCPALSRTSCKDPTEWIPPRESTDGIRVAIAHGSIGISEPDDFPISSKAASDKGLDFLALGHWHGVNKIDDRTWYCGAPEATAFGQPKAGSVLLVEISAPNSKPDVRPVEVARLKWRELERQVCTKSDVDALLKEIDSLAGSDVLLRLRVRGSLPQPELDRIELKGERFLGTKVEIDVSLENGILEFHHPLLRAMVDILVAKTEPSNPDAESARRALSQLRTLVKQAGFRNEDK